MYILVSLSKPICLPLWGRWQPEGLTEEAIERYVFAKVQTKKLFTRLPLQSKIEDF